MPKLSKFDFLVGGAVATAGLIATRRRPLAGTMMFAAGITAVALAEATVRERVRATVLPVTYDPVDTLKPLADGLWIVDSGPLHGLAPLRMTVIRLPDGGLLLHSPTRSTPALKAEIDRAGPVRAILAPNLAHWMYAPEWQRAYPAAQTWAAPGLSGRDQVKKAGMRIDHELSGQVPPEWSDMLEFIPVPGALGFTEVAVFHRPSRTLILADLVQNFEPQRLPGVLRPVARLLGNTFPGGRAPAHLRAVVRAGGSPAQQAAARLVALHADRVVFAHGRMVEQGAANALARSLSWLLPKELRA